MQNICFWINDEVIDYRAYSRKLLGYLFSSSFLLSGVYRPTEPYNSQARIDAYGKVVSTRVAS